MKEKDFPISVGSAVQWKWMGRFISGSVKEIYSNSVSKTIKGKLIKRHGSEENPAYLVESVSGNLALKLHSELQVSESKKANLRGPKMFSTLKVPGKSRKRIL